MPNIPQIPMRKKGDRMLAKDQRMVARAINSLSRGGGDVSKAGVVYYQHAFQPFFYHESGNYFVRVSQTKTASNANTKGLIDWVAPKIGSDSIVNPDPNDPSWVPPSVQMSAGDWGMWLIEGVADTSGKSSEIIIQQTSDPDPEPNYPWKKVFKLATWTVATVGSSLSAEDVLINTKRSIQAADSPFSAFEPLVWYDSDAGEYKAYFAPARVLFYQNGSALDVTIDGGDMKTSSGVTISDGDEWYVKIDTSSDGTPASADIQKATSPTTQQFEEALSSGGTSGEYYFKVCDFDIVDGLMIPTVYQVGDIAWNPRPWENVGSAAKVIKEFSAGSYKARTIDGSGTDPGSATGGSISGDTRVQDVFVDVQENGDELEISARVEIPDVSSEDGAVYNGSDYIHVDNGADPPIIELANSNQANQKPAAGTTGFFEYYTVVGGAVGHAAIYSTEPVALATAITQSTNTQQTSGGTSGS